MTTQREKPRSISKTCHEPITDEATLLASIRAGDQASCAEFVRQNAGRMLAVARRMLRCEHAAADAVQEAFISAFRSIGQFAGDAKMSTWLHRITVNACLMKLRAEKNTSSTSIESLLPTFDDTGHHAQRVSSWELPQDRMQCAELRAGVREAIMRLPEPYRVVLMLRDIEELDTQETADQLGLTTAAVKVRLHRARLALRTLLDPMLRNDPPAGG